MSNPVEGRQQNATQKIARVGIFAALVLAAAVLVADGQTTFASLARDVVARCATAENRPLCYDKELPKLMDGGLSMEEAFAITRIVQEKDPAYGYCHVLGHILSEKETARDPSKWLEVVHRAPSGICSNGAIHGAFQERFRRESFPEADVRELKAILQSACRAGNGWNPTPMEQATCTHGLGHLTMYITEANIGKALAVCDEVALNEGGRDFRPLCYDGAFMQIYEPLEPEDFDLIRGKEIPREGRNAFCAQFSGEAFNSCINESWPLYRTELEEPAGVRAFCGAFASPAAYAACVDDIAFVNAALWNLDVSRLRPWCDGMGAGDREICTASVAARIVENDWRSIDDAAAWCAGASAGAREACFDRLVTYSTYNFHQDSREARALCRALPEPFASRCRGMQ